MAKKKNKEAQNEEKPKEVVQEKPKEEQNDDAKKKEPPKEPPPVVLKTDIHCEGCASKLTKLARSFPDVQSARAEMASGKVTVVGPVDPLELRDFVAQKTRKKIDVISPIPVKSEKEGKKEAKEEKKEEKKAPEGKTEKKETPLALTTSVIKMSLHCQGCIEKIQRIVSKTKGVVDVSVDKQKETITVKGTMDVTALADTLKVKLKRNAEVMPTKDKDKEKDKGKEKKEEEKDKEEKKKPEDNGGGGKKEKKVDGGETATENRFMAAPGGFGYSGLPGFAAGPPVFPQQPSTSFVQPGQTVWFGHNSEPGYWYPPYSGYPPHMKFNDENPNACCVM